MSEIAVQFWFLFLSWKRERRHRFKSSYPRTDNDTTNIEAQHEAEARRAEEAQHEAEARRAEEEETDQQEVLYELDY